MLSRLARRAAADARDAPSDADAVTRTRRTLRRIAIALPLAGPVLSIAAIGVQFVTGRAVGIDGVLSFLSVILVVILVFAGFMIVSLLFSATDQAMSAAGSKPTPTRAAIAWWRCRHAPLPLAPAAYPWPCS